MAMQDAAPDLTRPKRVIWFSEKAGIALVAMSVFIFGLTLAPGITEEVKYLVAPPRVMPVVTASELPAGQAPGESVMVPVDESFGIVIPKIGANAKVIAEVDWRDSTVYQRALTKGVAHAAGTSFPDEEGNVFIFAHSGTNFYEAARYNAVFYLMNKLEPGDELFLFYRGQKYEYRVTKKATVGAEAVEYLERNSTGKLLTLMTCWPPGTTLRRLMVTAEERSTD